MPSRSAVCSSIRRSFDLLLQAAATNTSPDYVTNLVGAYANWMRYTQRNGDVCEPIPESVVSNALFNIRANLLARHGLGADGRVTDKARLEELSYQQLTNGLATLLVVDSALQLTGIPTAVDTTIAAGEFSRAFRNRAVADYCETKNSTRFRPGFHEELVLQAAQRIHDGEAMEAALAPARSKLMAAGFEIDYLEVRDAATLATVQGRYRKGLRMLIAARLGRTRLIDNIEV
jgi:hypothetical protein